MTGGAVPMSGDGLPEGLMAHIRAFMGPILPAMMAAGVQLPEGQENAMPQIYLDPDVLAVAQQLASSLVEFLLNTHHGVGALALTLQ